MSRPEPLAGERQSNESNKAVQAKNDWLRMGPGRSLTELWRKYREMPRNAAPTQSLYTIGAWSKHFGWELCAAQYDAEQERIKNERAAEIMNTGLALAYERVSKLKRLADFLEGEMYEIGKDVEGKDVHHNIWMPDVKQVGSGESPLDSRHAGLRGPRERSLRRRVA